MWCIVTLLCFAGSLLSSANDTLKELSGPTRSQFPSELSDAVRDFKSLQSLGNLQRIDRALRGGADLGKTRYRVSDLTDLVSREKLFRTAMQRQFWGILYLLGYQHQVQFIQEERKK